MKKKTNNKVCYHELAHAVVATWLGYKVYRITTKKDKDSNGSCGIEPVETNFDNTLISIAPYVRKKDFCLKQMLKYSRNTKDINECIKYISQLTEEEFKVHIEMVRMILKGCKDDIEAGKKALKNKDIIECFEGQEITGG